MVDVDFEWAEDDLLDVQSCHLVLVVFDDAGGVVSIVCEALLEPV